MPQKWCLPLIEQAGKGKKVEIVKNIPEMYHKPLKAAIQKVNHNSYPVWGIFIVPLIDPKSF